MYNSLSQLPSMVYNIFVYLAKSPQAENLWKMLKYNDYDCLSHDNLTFPEKMNLVWKNGNQEQFSVFFTPLVEDAITESKSVMKIYNYYVHKNELYYSTIVFAFDFLYGGNMSLIEYEGIPVSRGDMFINIILSTLNGADIGGVGKMSFSNELSRYTLGKSVIGNARTFTGVQLFLATTSGDSGIKTDLCDD